MTAYRNIHSQEIEAVASPLMYHVFARNNHNQQEATTVKRTRNEVQGKALSIPSFFYQMTPKISLNTRCSINISENLSINGRTRSSGQFGICSYNINP